MTTEYYSDEVLDEIWAKAQYVNLACEAKGLRKDVAGAWIRRDAYGSTDSSYGWEVDHIKPRSKGGGDDLANLQPLHCSNNKSKGDDYPGWMACVTADDDRNVRKKTPMHQD